MMNYEIFKEVVKEKFMDYIEDIVAHTVITEDEQVFFTGNYQVRINSPIITTGNELVKQQIADFSKQLNLEELYSYIFEVRESTEKILERFSYDETSYEKSTIN